MVVGGIRAGRSHGRGLLDAVEADPCGGRGDGHGTRHTHPQRVVVLPAVPPLPGGRTDLGKDRAENVRGESQVSSLRGRWTVLRGVTILSRH